MATDIFHPLVLSLDPAEIDDPVRSAPGETLPRAAGFLDLDRWERSAAAQESSAALAVRLRKAAERREPVAIGTLADPYGDRRAARTRRLLEACRCLEGLALSITTRSPWVVRDLDLLAEVDAYHAVSIEMPITAADAAVARRLEPEAAEPAERFEAVAALASHCIATTVWCLPIVPEENGREAVLIPLFAAAREAGARDVLGSPLFRRPAIDGGLLPRLAREIPGFARVCPGINRRIDRRQGADADARRLAATFRRLRLEHGFPVERPGRG
jgi:DNA repair photolyase